MIEKPIEQITAHDLQALVRGRALESRVLKFKREVPDEKGTGELLKDITALANGDGGDLLFGVAADKEGAATALTGLPSATSDTQILRIENLLRDCVDPRPTSYRLRWIETAPGQGVLLIRVGASLAAPHGVRPKQSKGFFVRNSAGKHEMDAHELRQAFTATEHLTGRLREFHQDAKRPGSALTLSP